MLQVGVIDGRQIEWLEQQVIDAGRPASADNWQTLEYPLTDYAGKTIGVVIEVSYGGANALMNEEAFFDEISVVID